MRPGQVVRSGCSATARTTPCDSRPMAEPYTDVATHVRDELKRVWLRLEYQIRLGWRKETGLVGGGEDVVGPEDMGGLFANARGAAQPGGDGGAEQVLEQWLAAHQATEARIRATIDAKIRSPFIDL